jgi:hypothetical protein
MVHIVTVATGQLFLLTVYANHAQHNQLRQQDLFRNRIVFAITVTTKNPLAL